MMGVTFILFWGKILPASLSDYEETTYAELFDRASVVVEQFHDTAGAPGLEVLLMAVIKATILHEETCSQAAAVILQRVAAVFQTMDIRLS